MLPFFSSTAHVLAREAFAPFTPRFDGRDEPREAWLSDPHKCTVRAAALRQMLHHERTAVGAIDFALI